MRDFKRKIKKSGLIVLSALTLGTTLLSGCSKAEPDMAKDVHPSQITNDEPATQGNKAVLIPVKSPAKEFYFDEDKQKYVYYDETQQEFVYADSLYSDESSVYDDDTQESDGECYDEYYDEFAEPDDGIYYDETDDDDAIEETWETDDTDFIPAVYDHTDYLSKTESSKYLVLVNQKYKVDPDWENKVSFIDIRDADGDPTKVECETYSAYQKLKNALAKKGIMIGIGSAYRSVSDQQELVTRYTAEYGKDYVEQYVATPGYSEHHTGLAIDLRLFSSDGSVSEWNQIHEALADYGFILRYLPDKEDITGYSYECWHIRYVGSPEVAHQIMDRWITLEEYLGESV